jgi:hypothetical protein
MTGISEIPQGIKTERFKGVRKSVDKSVVDELVEGELPEDTHGRFELAMNIRRRAGVLTDREDSSAIPVYPDVNREREPWIH